MSHHQVSLQQACICQAQATKGIVLVRIDPRCSPLTRQSLTMLHENYAGIARMRTIIQNQVWLEVMEHPGQHLAQHAAPRTAQSEGSSNGSARHPGDPAHASMLPAAQTDQTAEGTQEAAPEVGGVLSVVGQGHIQGGFLLARGEVGGAVHADREHSRLVLEDEGGPITLQSQGSATLVVCSGAGAVWHAARRPLVITGMLLRRSASSCA